MVAPNQAMRVGSGGLTYQVDGDTTALRAKLSDAAQWAKAQKIKPDIDFEQTAIIRGFEKIRRAIQRETFKIPIVAELDKQGLGDIARQMGIIKTQMAQAVPGEKFGPSRAHRVVGFEAEVRSDMAAELRRIRADTRRHEVRKAARSELGLPEDDDGYTKMVPMPEKPSALSRLFTTANAIRLGIAGTAVHGATRAMVLGGSIIRGAGDASSPDAIGAAGGRAQIANAVGAIPVVGAFSELAGVARGLSAELKALTSIENRAVRVAQLSGDPVAVASAEHTVNMNRLGRDLRSAVGSYTFASALPGVIGKWGMSSNAAAIKAILQDIRGQQGEDAMSMEIATLAQGASFRSLATSGGAAMLSGQFKPQAAFLANLRTQLANADDTAPPFMRNMLAPVRGITGGMFGVPKLNLQSMVSDSMWGSAIATLRREGGLSEFAGLTPVGVGELTTQFRGNSLPGDTFARLRELQGGIDATPDESILTANGRVSLRGLKRTAALSTARGIGAQLDYQQGGQAMRINAGLGQGPDAMVHTAAFEARLEARRMTAEFVRNNGGIAGQEFGPLSGLKETNELLRAVISAIGKLKDNGQGATPLIQTAPRGGARRDDE